MSTVVSEGMLELHLNDIALLQIRFRLICNVHLPDTRKLRHHNLIHAGLRHNPGAGIGPIQQLPGITIHHRPGNRPQAQS